MKMDSSYFPDFLYLSLSFWIIMLLVFLGFYLYLRRIPDDRILKYKAKAIENKRKLGIKIYKF